MKTFVITTTHGTTHEIEAADFSVKDVLEFFDEEGDTVGAFRHWISVTVKEPA